MRELLNRLWGYVRWSKPSRPAGIERRRAARAKAPARMAVCFLEGPREEFGDGRVLDISESGLHFSSDVKPAKGSELMLKVHFPKAFSARPPLKLQARVVRSLRSKNHPDYQVACAFTGLDAAGLRCLREFVDWAALQ